MKVYTDVTPHKTVSSRESLTSSELKTRSQSGASIAGKVGLLQAPLLRSESAGFNDRRRCPVNLVESTKATQDPMSAYYAEAPFSLLPRLIALADCEDLGLLEEEEVTSLARIIAGLINRKVGLAWQCSKQHT